MALVYLGMTRLVNFDLDVALDHGLHLHVLDAVKDLVHVARRLLHVLRLELLVYGPHDLAQLLEVWLERRENQALLASSLGKAPQHLAEGGEVREALARLGRVCLALEA